MSAAIEVIQNLHVFRVECDGADVRVDIYGSDDCVCGTLVYRFEDERERDQRARLLRRWCDDGVAVTYVRREGCAALLDEMAVLSEAFASTA